MDDEMIMDDGVCQLLSLENDYWDFCMDGL